MTEHVQARALRLIGDYRAFGGADRLKQLQADGLPDLAKALLLERLNAGHPADAEPHTAVVDAFLAAQGYVGHPGSSDC